MKDFGPRISRPHLPGAERQVGIEGNQFLFTRDLPLGIMPSRIRAGEEFRVQLEPADGEVTTQLLSLLDIGRFSRRELDEATVDFVETVARLIGYRGEALFELIGGGTDQPPSLGSLPPLPVLRAPGGYYQLIPKGAREQLETGTAIRIPVEKIWRVRLPRRLGGVRGHRRLLRALGARSSPHPRFILEGTDMGRSAGYDFAAHHRACEVEIERATRRWGTIPSRFRVEGTTEYFLFSRRLAFKRAQAELREHILVELNRLLARLGLTHRLEVSGLRSAAEIEETMRQLQAGELTVSEAMRVDDP